MSEPLKKIEEVFPDFKAEDGLVNAGIKNVNVYKKLNTFVVELVCATKVHLKYVYQFEKYLKDRFKVKDAEIKLENTTEVAIETEWENIKEYLNLKYPLTKSILTNSSFEVLQNKGVVTLAIKGKDFLISSGFEKILQHIISIFYGVELKIQYIERIDKELVKRYEENARRTEKMAIELAEQEINFEAIENNDSSKSNKKPNENVKGNSSQGMDAPVEQPPIPEPPQEKSPLILGRSLNIKENVVKVEDLGIDSGKIALEGEIISMDSRELKSGKTLVMFDVYDGTSTITCKSFVVPEKVKDVISRLKSAKGVKIAGTAQFDPFAKELGVIANVIIEIPGRKKEKRVDNAEVKRVELHMHTQMSQMDGVSSAKDLIKRAMSWGMKSIAITDHGVVQAFPDAHKLLGRNNKDMKVIYGVEAYLVPDKTLIVGNPKNQDIDTTYCVLDLETTGFSFRTEKITEIGIMKYKNGEVIDSFSTFVNPEKPIPPRVVEVTNITDDMVKDAPKIEEVFPKMLEFIGDSVLVAHNADFDIGFLKYNAAQLGYEFNYTYLDTLRLAKELFPEFKRYKLGLIADKLGITVEVAHRALDDVDTTVKVLRVMMEKLKEKGAKTVEDIDKVAADDTFTRDAYKKLPVYHAIILAKNYVGLKNLYKLVSLSHLHYFYM